MNIIFKELSINDEDTPWGITLVDSESPKSIAEYYPEKKELWMPKNVPMDVLKHEAWHLMFDYLRDMNKEMDMWPFDPIKKSPSGFDEHFIIFVYEYIVDVLSKNWMCCGDDNGR